MQLFNFLKEKNNVKTDRELSKKIKIPPKTLQKYKLGERYIPEKIVSSNIRDLEIIESKKIIGVRLRED